MKKTDYAFDKTGVNFKLTRVDSQGRKHFVEIGALAAGLRRYKIDDKQIVACFVDGAGFPNIYSGIVLFPWVNRLEDGKFKFGGSEYVAPINEHDKHNQLHGYSQFYYFDVISQSDSEITLGCRLPMHEHYKFDVYTEVTYKLTDRGLEISAESENLGDSPAPWSFGFHPWFSIRGDYDESGNGATIQINADKVVSINERSLPIEETGVHGKYDARTPKGFTNTTYDDAWIDFKKDGNPDVILKGADGHLTKVTASKNLLSYQLCTLQGQTLDGPQNTIAIEPCTSYANAFKTGDNLIELKPNQPFECSWLIEFE